MTVSTERRRIAVVRQAAQRLESASRTGEPCAPVRDLIGETDLDAAYAVQRQLADRRVRGRRAGRGTQDRPDLARRAAAARRGPARLRRPLRRHGRLRHAPRSRPARLLQPRVEAEIAFVLGRRPRPADLDRETCAAAVDHAVAAIEIVDSRVAGWDIRITDTDRRQRLQRAVRARRAARVARRFRPGRRDDADVRRRRARLRGHGRRLPRRPAQRAALARSHRASSRRPAAGRSGRSSPAPSARCTPSRRGPRSARRSRPRDGGRRFGAAHRLRPQRDEGPR